MSWQDDYYRGSSDYPSTGSDRDLPDTDAGGYFDPWDNPLGLDEKCDEGERA